MIEPATAFVLFDKLLSGLGLLREGKKIRNEQTDAALAALFKALNATKPYLDLRASGSPRDMPREYAIALAWHEAAIPLRAIDPQLKRLCFLKGSSWLEPDLWNNERIVQNNISFSQVLKATETLLNR